MDRLEAMTILTAAADTGSLSAASRDLRIPLATVSRRVSELEAHLNVRLLHRSNRKLVLTDAGRSYVASCRRILEEIAEAEREAFDMVRIQGLTQAEAARVLGVSVVTVKRRLNRGLQLLADSLGDLCPGAEAPDTP